VLLFHVPMKLPSVTTKPIFEDGAFGVSFFFVLSGFILAHVYKREFALDYPSFLYKRWARIYPLHALTFIIWCCLFWGVGGIPLDIRVNTGIANILLLQSLFSGDAYNLGYNAVSWTISVEMFFYIFFPLLRRPKILICFLIIDLLIALSLSQATVDAILGAFPSFFWFNPIARVSEFAIGIAAYEIFKKLAFLKPAMLWLGTIFECLAIGLLVVVTNERNELPDQFTVSVLSLPFALIIILFARQEGILSKFLALSPFILLGEASYALYLIHHMWFRIMQDLLGNTVKGWELLLIAISSVILISILVHYTYEKPIRALLLRKKHYSSSLI
jgi:peptidoglycan/LPS O-acetylase OafA/YrhL